MLRRFWRHFWTRKSAVGVLIAILLLVAICAVIQVSEIWGKAWSNVASIGVIVLTAVTAVIAYFGIPASPKQEARRKIQRAINSYVILDSLGAKSDQRNRVMNRMRELARDVDSSCEEIADYLQSSDVGERFAALASVQWQWSKDKDMIYREMGDFTRYKKMPSPPEQPDKGYFPALLKILSDSWSEFENYHATVAMWSMLESLEPEQIKELCDKVIGKVLPNRGKEWEKFTGVLKEKCG